METVMCLDLEASSLLIQRFDVLRGQGKFIDLQITTKDGKRVDAHRLILAAKFPLLLETLTSKRGEIAIYWKRFSADIVEAVVNYAYTGKLAISAGNATRLYLLANNLGSKRIVSWCVDFLRTRISLDNVAEVWSIANATLNCELMELCIPLMTEHFEDLCLRRELLMQVTQDYFEMMLESKQLKGVSEETKFRAIRNWLDAGIGECDLEEKPKIFGKMISRIELTRLSPQCQSEYWTFVRGYSDQFIEGDALQNRRMQPDGKVAKQRFRPVSNCPPLSKEVLMIYGYNRVSKSRCLASVPQLQPEESFNVKVPSGGIPTALDGRVCFVMCDDSESSVMSVNYRDGSISYKSFTTKRRVDYAVASRNESIFIFGGYYNGQSVSTCEKLDIVSGELTQLPDMLSARCNASALNIPEIGIVVVGGGCKDNRQTTGSRYAEVLLEDPRNESGWRWIKLNPMLKARNRPGVAYFKGCVIVAGGDEKFSAECFPLTSIKQTNAQWTYLRTIRNRGLKFASLVAFNNRLILLLRKVHGTSAYEFLPTEENQSLATFEWKPIFRLDDFTFLMLLVAREKLEEH